jgi:hypothetical protein
LRVAKIGIASAGNATEAIAIDEYYPHPSWDFESGAYDLMIVKLVSPSSAGWATVNSDAAMPSVVPATEIDAIGIGATSAVTPGIATTLQQMPLIHIAQMSCFALIQVSGAVGPFYRQLPADHMCLTDYSVAMDGHCTGDEGGPMVEMGEALSGDVIVGVMAV